MSIRMAERSRRHLVDLLDVGSITALLCSPFAEFITGGTIYVDGGDDALG